MVPVVLTKCLHHWTNVGLLKQIDPETYALVLRALTPHLGNFYFPCRRQGRGLQRQGDSVWWLQHTVPSQRDYSHLRFE